MNVFVRPLLVCYIIVESSVAFAQGAPSGIATPAPPAAPEAVAPSNGALPPLTESLTGEAKAEYAAARILFDDGDFAGALTKLTKAHRLSADPRLLWNMAAAEKNLRHYSKVIEYVTQFIATGAPYVNEEDRVQAQQLLAAVQGFVSSVTFEVQPSDVQIQVDGKPVGTSPLAKPVAIDFGHHELSLTRTGYRTETRKLELEGGKPVQVTVTLNEELHQGTLKVVTDTKTTIRVDGKVTGVGMWQGVVPSGTHTVQLEGEKKVPQTTEVVVSDGETRSFNVLLIDQEEKKKGIPSWVWVASGVAAVGLGTGAYFLFHSSADRPPVQQGTWSTLEF